MNFITHEKKTKKEETNYWLVSKDSKSIIHNKKIDI